MGISAELVPLRHSSRVGLHRLLTSDGAISLRARSDPPQRSSQVFRPVEEEMFAGCNAAMIDSALPSLQRAFAAYLLSLFVTWAAVAGGPISAVNTEQGLAVKGYDPVAYFTTGQPTRGLAQFS